MLFGLCNATAIQKLMAQALTRLIDEEVRESYDVLRR